MKRALYMIMAIMMIGVLFIGGCTPVDGPAESDVPVEQSDGIVEPNAVTLIGSKWSSGNLEFYDKSSGNTMLTMDGTNEDIEITTLTATAGTVGGADIVSVSGSQTLTNKTLTSPVIGGTMVNANVAMGSDNVSAGEASATFAHGLSSTPTFVLVSCAGDTGDDYYIYWSSADSANITVGASANITSNTAFTWVAWVAGE